MKTDIRRGWSTLWLAGCLLVASVFIWQGLPSSAQSSSGIASKGIETLRVGDRVFIAEETHAGRDLSLGEEIDPSSWRKLTFRLLKTDGELMDVVLLRPLKWIEEAGAKVGATIPLNLEEIGVSGPATVDRIEPCPSIRPGTGRPITGTFSHELSNVIELRVKGADEPLRVTTSHKMYSASRKDFVPAGELKEGEELLDRNGLVQIASVAPYPGKYRVYNLEVFVDHVYHVTNTGLLAHNMCAVNAVPDRYSGRYADGQKAYRTTLPRDSNNTPLPIEGANGAHSRLQRDAVDPTRIYSATEFNSQGNAVRRIDFAGRSGDVLPHEHLYDPQTKGFGPKMPLSEE